MKMETQTIKGIATSDTFVMLNGVTGISGVDYYIETLKDEYGKKYKKKHAFFNILYKGGATIRFERLREGVKTHTDSNDWSSIIVYVDETLTSVRDKIIAQLKDL